jgi:hypothetical protein
MQQPDKLLTPRALSNTEASSPGDLVHLDGMMPPAEPPKVLKLDEWKQVGWPVSEAPVPLCCQGLNKLRCVLCRWCQGWSWQVAR